MEPREVRNRVAIALGLKMGIDHEKARVVGDTVLKTIQECGLITLASSDLAQVNHMVAVGIGQNMRLRAALVEIQKLTDDDQTVQDICESALADPDDQVIEGELAPAPADD